MQGAGNGPWMDEDPVGPRHWVAGGPVGYKNGMRDRMGPQAKIRVWHRTHNNPVGSGYHSMLGLGR